MRFSLVAILAAAFAAPSMAFVQHNNLALAKLATGRHADRAQPMMDVKVMAGDGEPMESLLRRFKREVNKSGHLMELRHRRYFEDSQDVKKRKIKEARRRKKAMRMAARKGRRF